MAVVVAVVVVVAAAVAVAVATAVQQRPLQQRDAHAVAPASHCLTTASRLRGEGSRGGPGLQFFSGNVKSRMPPVSGRVG